MMIFVLHNESLPTGWILGLMKTLDVIIIHIKNIDAVLLDFELTASSTSSLCDRDRVYTVFMFHS